MFDKTKQFLVYHNDEIICTGVNEEISLNENDLKRIERKYNIRIVNKDEAIDDNDLYAFLLTAKENYLLLEIMEGSIGEDNKVEWNSIYSCKLFKDKKKIEENGFGEFDFWKQELEEKRKILNEEFSLNVSYMSEVRKVFPSLVYFSKFYDFLDMYESQGFYTQILNINENAIKKGKVSPYIGKKYDHCFVKYAQMRQIVLANDVLFEVCLIQGDVIEGRMNIKEKGYAYISKNYVMNVNIRKLSDLMDSTLVYSQFYYDEFDKKYPDIMLKNYITSGGRFVIPFLLSLNHNHIMELAGKAGCGFIADRIYSEKNFNWNSLNSKETNLKKIFNLPIRAIKNLNKEELQFGMEALDFDFFQKINQTQPSILNMNLTFPMVKFIEYESLHNNDFWNKEIKSKTFLNMLRYVEKMDRDEEHLYQDYLQMCRLQNLRDDGWTPTNLRQAHDALITYMNEKRESIRNENFNVVVQTGAYKRFLWEYGNFCFLIPRDANDLVTESYQQRNCVRGYVNSVASGYTYIVFMRLKSKKSSSFVTIEVSNRNELRQAKGKGNSYVDNNTAKVIRLWCDEKGISYKNCWDLDERRFSRRY